MNGYPLKLYDKQGFRNPNGNPVVILDQRGKVFYDTRELEHRVFEFNLPPGDYIVVAGRIQPRIKPVEYAKMPLPNPERYKRGNPEHFEIVFADNPNKCSVDWISRQIIYDNAFKDTELPKMVFIYLHECGHRYYQTEHYCDAYAYNRMIDQGYNPSQIGLTIIDTLSDRANDRKAYIVDGILSNEPLNKIEASEINHYESVDVNYTLGTKVDEKWDTADDFIGAELIASETVISYTGVNGTRKKVYQPGQKIGIIASYVNTPGGLWWQLVDGSFVKAKTGAFDSAHAKQSVRDGIAQRNKEIAEKAKERQDANDNPLYNFGKGFEKFLDFITENFSVILLLIVALVVMFIVKALKS